MIPFPWTIYSEEAAGGSSFRFGNVTGHCHLDGWLGRPLVSDQPSENSKRSLINCQEEVLLPPSLSICHFLSLLTFTNTILISPSILSYSSSREGRCRPIRSWQFLLAATCSQRTHKDSITLGSVWSIGAFVKTLNHKWLYICLLSWPKPTLCKFPVLHPARSSVSLGVSPWHLRFGSKRADVGWCSI